MYGRPGIIYGVHGCDRRVGEAILASHTEHLKSSKNDYDWLGHGIYFWEASPERGLEFARAAKVRKRISQGKIRYPYVVGAVIELGNCLNLLDHSGLMEMRAAHKMLKSLAEVEGKQLPANKFKDKSGAYLVRALDCAVLEYLHQMRMDANLPAYDTVIGALWEGSDLYDDAGVTDKNHMQICVRNEECTRVLPSPGSGWRKSFAMGSQPLSGSDTFIAVTIADWRAVIKRMSLESPDASAKLRNPIPLGVRYSRTASPPACAACSSTTTSGAGSSAVLSGPRAAAATADVRCVPWRSARLACAA
jgi:hypothetical protein